MDGKITVWELGIVIGKFKGGRKKISSSEIVLGNGTVIRWGTTKKKKNILSTCSQFLLIKKGIAKISPDQAAKHNKSPNSFAKEENYRR